jgi:DNA topoisomerase IA
MNAKRVLDTAEKIYSKGYISYPRFKIIIVLV